MYCPNINMLAWSLKYRPSIFLFTYKNVTFPVYGGSRTGDIIYIYIWIFCNILGYEHWKYEHLELQKCVITFISSNVSVASLTQVSHICNSFNMSNCITHFPYKILQFFLCTQKLQTADANLFTWLSVELDQVNEASNLFQTGCL